MISQAFRRFSTQAGGKKVGFLGLGNMGGHMARNLLNAGYSIKGFDVSELACKNADPGIVIQDSMASAVKDVDYVVLSLPKTDYVAHALRAPDGVFANASPGTYICDTSTISPVASAEFAAEAPKHGVTFLDTPMSGGVQGAEAATLAFMVGAETPADFDHCKDMLACMGKNVFHCGGPGKGEVAKIVNNLILGITMIGVSEGFAIGQKLGADPKLMQQICAVSSARSWVMDTYHPVPGVVPTSPASSSNYEKGFQVSLVKKDMALAMEVADEVNADKSITEFCHNYYLAMEKLGKGDKDFGFAFQYIMNNKKIDK